VEEFFAQDLSYLQTFYRHINEMGEEENSQEQPEAQALNVR
jgi:hypothetical protein